MKVIVSACLLGKNCKYNGGNNRNEKVIEFLKDKEIIEVCPEVLAGRGTLPPISVRLEQVCITYPRRTGYSATNIGNP